MRTGLFVIVVLLNLPHVSAADQDCRDIRDPGAAALVSRIKRADAEALRIVGARLECFTPPQRREIGLAAARLFDADPVGYLAKTGAAQDDGIDVWLQLLVTLPVDIAADDDAAVTLLGRRASSLERHAPRVAPSKLHAVWVEFASRMSERVARIAKRFPNPPMLIEPLTGILINRNRARMTPTALDWLSPSDLARTDLTITFASVRSKEGRTYALIAGTALQYAGGAKRATGLAAEEGWVVRVTGNGRFGNLEWMGPARLLFWNPDIPPSVAEDLCAAAVRNLEFMMNKERAQSALDARIAREPGAAMVKPLRDALMRAGYDVTRYREVAPPRKESVMLKHRRDSGAAS